jgi:RNA polymerase sigma-70 factor (ECF subfamily)
VDTKYGEVTLLLMELQKGNKDAEAKLIPLVYSDLRRLAAYYMRGERREHTLQATALVHEAYLRLTKLQEVNWQNRSHFYAVAAQLMRRILVDYARAYQADKREAAKGALSLDEALFVNKHRPKDLVALDDALEQLSKRDPRQARIVELRFFAGLNEEETAVLLGISSRTVKREWRIAKAWLAQEIGCSGG